MGQILVRKLDDDIKERLRERAKRNGRTLEAEARAVLEAAASSQAPDKKSGLGLGTELLARLQEIGLTNEDWEEFDRSLQENRRLFTVREIDFDA